MVAEPVEKVEVTEELVEDTVDWGDADMGSADDITDAEVAVAPASDEVVDASLKATSMVDPVSPSIRSVCELPATVWTERVAPDPSITWITEMVWTTSVMIESLGSSSATSSCWRLWNSACE